MAQEFRLPDIGEGLAEAEIVRWVKAVGDQVATDETVVEVETDKAVVEIPSPFAGVVLFHGAAEGEVIEVGDVLVVVGEAGERYPSAEDAAAGATSSSADAAPIVGTLSEDAEELPGRADELVAAIRSVQALPLVRKLAKDMGVDIGMIAGSGPVGRVTREDVLAAAGDQEPPPEPSLPPVPGFPPEAPAAPAESAPQPVAASVPASEGADPERRPLSRLRKTIAANMTKSWTEIPHVTTFDEIDATRLLAMRAALGQRHGQSIPMEAFVVKAVLPVLDEFPEFNSTLDGDHLVLHGRRDIGIAVDTPDGLLVAVVKAARGRSILDLATEVRRLGGAAKERALAPAELTGQTFTVSNIGAVGGGFGTPIVPSGTVAILSIGRAADKPVARDGSVVIAPILPVSLSYDHRVVDGGLGRRFMAMLIENLEEPGLFLA